MAAGELVAAEQGGDVQEPVVEIAGKDMEARAREIAQRYLETIPEEDRNLTDPKQVEHLLYVLENTDEPRRDLFAPTDKLGNMPKRVLTAFMGKDTKGMAQGWREFAQDPVSIAKETDKIKVIAGSPLPESVRTALLSIILKEGDYSVVDASKEATLILEQGGDVGLKLLLEKYSSPEALKALNYETLIIPIFQTNQKPPAQREFFSLSKLSRNEMSLFANFLIRASTLAQKMLRHEYN